MSNDLRACQAAFVANAMQFAVCEKVGFPAAKKETFKHDLQWMKIDDMEAPVTELHHWLVEFHKHYGLDKQVNCWESVCFWVLELEVDLEGKLASVYVFDVHDQEHKMFFFKWHPDIGVIYTVRAARVAKTVRIYTPLPFVCNFNSLSNGWTSDSNEWYMELSVDWLNTAAVLFVLKLCSVNSRCKNARNSVCGFQIPSH